jgi:hypothetical protein
MPNPEWISVQIQLPKGYAAVMVFMRLRPNVAGSHYDFAYYCPPIELMAGRWASITLPYAEEEGHSDVRGDVTHWMPLPAPPEAA